MRRTVGLILAGLGAFFIVMTIVLPAWIVPSITKFPLNEYKTATLTASNATYFSPKLLSVLNGVNITATYTMKGSGVGTSSRATWEVFNDTYDTTTKTDISEMDRVFSFDRQTTALINCCGSTYTYTGPGTVNIGYVFPFGTGQHNYTVYDSTVQKPETYKYTGQDTIDGIPVYTFTEDVAPTNLGFLPLSSTDPQFATEHNIFWIDPSTGAILNVDQHTTRYLADPTTGAITQTLFDADLKFTPATIQSVVGLDNSGRNELQLLNIILPLLFGFLGVVLMAAGFILYRREQLIESARSASAGSGLDGDGSVRGRHAATAENSAGTPANVSVIPGLDSGKEESGGS
jgi:Porin PorA